MAAWDVDNLGNLHENVALDDGAIAKNYGCTYGSGIFELSKL